MSRVAFLDSGPLGDITKPHPSNDVTRWVRFIKEQRILLRISEIIDYELRRELTLQGLRGEISSYTSIRNLNKYRRIKQFLPLDSSVTLTDACDIWANLRFNNQATADIKNIDVDVILAAHALSVKDKFDEVIIVTGNASDICRFQYLGLKVWDWKQALHDYKYGTINFYQELPRPV
jgi:hypothetical protein